MFHYAQLSFIQLAGGIAVGVHAKQNSNLTESSELQFIQTLISLGVRTTALQVCSWLSNDITLQAWIVASVLCDIMIAMCMTYYVGFSNFILESEQITILVHYDSFRDAIPPSKKLK